MSVTSRTSTAKPAWRRCSTQPLQQPAIGVFSNDDGRARCYDDPTAWEERECRQSREDAAAANHYFGISMPGMLWCIIPSPDLLPFIIAMLRQHGHMPVDF